MENKIRNKDDLNKMFKEVDKTKKLSTFEASRIFKEKGIDELFRFFKNESLKHLRNKKEYSKKDIELIYSYADETRRVYSLDVSETKNIEEYLNYWEIYNILPDTGCEISYFEWLDSLTLGKLAEELIKGLDKLTDSGDEATVEFGFGYDAPNDDLDNIGTLVETKCV